MQINSTDFVRALVKQNRDPRSEKARRLKTSPLQDNVFALRNSLDLLTDTLKQIKELSETVRDEIVFIEEVVDEIESVI